MDCLKKRPQLTDTDATSSDGGFDGSVAVDPRIHFPIEVWNIIAKKLDPPSFYMLSKSSKVLYDFFGESFSTTLLSMILPLLDSGDRSFLKLRQLSKKYKMTIDDYCNRQLDLTDLSLSRSYTTELDRDDTTSYYFNQVEHIDDFMETMLSRSKPKDNPFLTRMVILDDYRYFRIPPVQVENDEDEDAANHAEQIEDDYDRFWVAAQSMMKVYGQHIKWFSLYTTISDFKFLVKVFAQITQMLPNLQGLSIHSYYNFMNTHMEVLEKFPFARLSKLRSLKIKDGWETKMWVQEFMRQINPNQMEELFELSPSFLVKCTNLKKVKTSFSSEEALRRLSAVPWNIVTLDVHFHLREDELDGIKFQHATAWINHFSDSLATLQIRLSGNTNIGAKNLGNLELKKLKYLGVVGESMITISSLSFVKRLEELEELYVYFMNCQFPISAIPDEEIQFSGFKDKMLESNIWTVLPKLERVHLADIEASKEYYRLDYTPLVI